MSQGQESLQTGSKKHTKSPESESLQSYTIKSPRKSLQQTSPSLPTCLNSPSSTQLIEDIIDISSDSDVPSSPTKISIKTASSLTREKVKKRNGISPAKDKHLDFEATLRDKSVRVVAENDIIDLT
jgi:hypothetical protein